MLHMMSADISTQLINSALRMHILYIQMWQSAHILTGRGKNKALFVDTSCVVTV